MKKSILGVLGVLAVFSLSGCATEDYVRSQVNPLAERLGKLESKVSQINGMTDADKAAIKQANDKSQQALDAANQVSGNVQKAEAAAARAEKAAKDAENAAGEAQQMEKKSEKIFKLEQKK